jgi:antibiotic biosynthesis monooxygenase (ABM) superfamily enzyme
VYVKPTAPRSIGGILDDAVRLYRDSFAKAWPLALCAQLALAVPLLFIRTQFAAVPGAMANPMATAANSAAALAVFKSPGIWLSYLAVMLVTIGFYNALLVLIDGLATAKTESFGRSLTAGFRLLPRTFLLFLAMFAVAVIGTAIVGILVSIIHVPIVVGILVAAYAALFLYAWGRAFLANIAVVVEDAGAFSSLGMSWALIKNHWWRTAAVYTIAIVIAMVFYVVISILSGVALVVLHSSIDSSMIVSQLVSIVGGTVLMSFVPAVLLVTYYDLRLRKGGADLASRVSALAPQ